MGLILAGAEAQRPSAVLPFLYVGGVAAARSRHVLQHLGITHIVNMAPDDTLGEDGTLGEFPDCFHYTHYQVRAHDAGTRAAPRPGCGDKVSPSRFPDLWSAPL